MLNEPSCSIALQKAGLIAKVSQASNDKQNYTFSEGKAKLTDKAFLNSVGRKVPVEETTTKEQQPVNKVKEEKADASSREEPAEPTMPVVKVKEGKETTINKKTNCKKKKSGKVKGKVLEEQKNDLDEEQDESKETDAAVKKDDEEQEDEFKHLDDEGRGTVVLTD